jgi:hypothetical protein
MICSILKCIIAHTSLGIWSFSFLRRKWKDTRDWNKPLLALAPNSFWQPGAVQFWPYADEVSWPPEKDLGDNIIEQFIYRFNAPVHVPIRPVW